MLDFSRCRLAPFPHQREDVQAVIDHPFYFIASECRTGKTKIIIDAAQFLFEAGTIDTMIVVAPAAVRDVWYDDRLGELAKHLWPDVPATIAEFHARNRSWQHGPDAILRLTIWVTNFEFLRSKNRLMQLLAACGPKTMLVGDESSAIKNYAAAQTKAFLQLRRACGRVYLLNGTPVFLNPLDLFSQGNILSPTILDCKYITHFKARYAIMTPVLGYSGKPLQNPRGGGPIKKVTGWTNLEDLQARFSKHTVRRLQATLNLPPKLDPVTLTATLSDSWPLYQQMKSDMVVWLKENVATAATAAVKALRLSQITGGFIGGVEAAGIEPVDDALLESIDLGGRDGYGRFRDGQEGVSVDRPEPRGDHEFAAGGIGGAKEPQRVEANTGGVQENVAIGGYHGRNDVELDHDHSSGRCHHQPYALATEVGREKLDVLLWFIEQRLEADPNLHLVVWCRFRAEMLRALDTVRSQFPQFACGAIMGGQKRAERLRALALLKPETSPEGPVFVCGIEGTGSFGLDFTAAHTCVTMSSGYSPGRSAQTLDRVYGPGQRFPIAYYDIVAVGPKGQKTIDRDILLARRAGQDIAEWTSAAWVRALTEE